MSIALCRFLFHLREYSSNLDASITTGSNARFARASALVDQMLANIGTSLHFTDRSGPPCGDSQEATVAPPARVPENWDTISLRDHPLLAGLLAETTETRLVEEHGDEGSQDRS